MNATPHELKLTVYFGERARAGGRLLTDELLDRFAAHGLRSSILLRGAQGFGAKHRLRTDRLLTLSEDLPLLAHAVDQAPRIEAAHADALRLLETPRRGLVTLESVSIVAREQPRDDARSQDREGARNRPRDEHLGQPWGDPDGSLALSVYVGRHERLDGRPAFVAACELLRRRGLDGATVLLGVDGTSRGARERARFFARNARVPALILAVGEASAIASAAPALLSQLPGALVTIERVRVLKRDGRLLNGPFAVTGPCTVADTAQAAAPEVPDAPQRLTVVTSEAATHDGRAVHLELLRRLRGADLAGATSLRGVWGFHGDHEPHGDRLLSFRRHVPIVTVIVDTAARIARAFPIVDELTHERGLVTIESLPANMRFSARL